jgi:hypothetical protein
VWHSRRRIARDTQAGFAAALIIITIILYAVVGVAARTRHRRRGRVYRDRTIYHYHFNIIIVERGERRKTSTTNRPCAIGSWPETTEYSGVEK